ncbi:hypothetical protein V8F33_002166 [Rhypophila sp. PSN 637]
MNGMTPESNTSSDTHADDSSEDETCHENVPSSTADEDDENEFTAEHHGFINFPTAKTLETTNSPVTRKGIMDATKAPGFSSRGSLSQPGLPAPPQQQPPNPPEKQHLPQAARHQWPQLQEPVPIRPPFTVRQTPAAVNPFSLQAAPTQTLQTMPTQMGQTTVPRNVMHQCYSTSHHQPLPQLRHFSSLQQPIRPVPVRLQYQQAVSTPQQAQTFRLQNHQQHGPAQTVIARLLEDQSDSSHPSKRPRLADVSAESNTNIVAAVAARDAMIETLMTENQALKARLSEFESLEKDLHVAKEKLADIELRLQLAGFQVVGQTPRLGTGSSLGGGNPQ